MPSCFSPMKANAVKEKDKVAKKMSRVGSWGTMGFYSSSSSSSCRSRSQPVAAAAEGKNGGGGGKKKRRSSISRSITCAGSICSTKESSVSSRGRGRRRSSGGGDGGGSTSSRSLMGPDHGDSAASVSASSSFNSVMTTATSATTSSSTTSPPSALFSPLSSIGGSFKTMQIRKLSGCYLQSHSVPDPRSIAAAAAAAAVFSCSDCDEFFVKPDSLELHRSTRHAVSELGPDDTSRNIVEIIFQSSWLKKNASVCKIDRILKVHGSDKTIKKFEQYKELVKEKASGDEAKKNPRCVADGNELLRFHCTTFACSLGLAGGTALCCGLTSSPHCKLCAIIRDGFRVDGNGRIATMATSGRAHDTAEVLPDGEKRAMLVCRVVAGRVKKVSSSSSEEHDCDSVSPCSEGVYSDLDELFVFSPRAVLPCFVVIYSGY